MLMAKSFFSATNAQAEGTCMSALGPKRNAAACMNEACQNLTDRGPGPIYWDPRAGIEDGIDRKTAQTMQASGPGRVRSTAAAVKVVTYRIFRWLHD